MEYDDLPKESQEEIDKIVNKHSLTRTEVVDHYVKIFKRSFVGSAKSDAEKHEWVSRIVKSEFEDRPPTGKKDFIVLGKGPIQYSKKSKSITTYMLILDANNKNLTTMVLRGKDVALMDQFQCGDMYQGVLCGADDKGTFYGDDRMNPIPQGTPSKNTVPEIFGALVKKKALKIVTFSDLDKKGNMTQVGSTGWPVRTDIRCFMNCFVVRSWKGAIEEWKHFEVERGNMTLKDDSNDFDGYTDDDGLEWPNKITAWGNPEFLFPKHSVCNAWGVVSRNKESKELSIELVYADPIHLAEDTD